MRLHVILLAGSLLAPIALAQTSDDAVFRAMQDEMARTTRDLSIAPMAPPYFVGYRVQDVDELSVEARYGALTEGNRARHRYLMMDLRTGAPERDNSGFVGDWQDVYRGPDDLTVENDYASLRHDLWLLTDAAYKSALENLSRKNSYLQTHPPQEVVPDFSPATPFVAEGRAGSLRADLPAWEAEVTAASRVMDEFPALQDWKVSYLGRGVTARYLNSEGSRFRRGLETQILEVTASAQAPDGQRLSAIQSFVARDDDRPPTGEALASGIRRMAGDLQAMAAAPRLDEYNGPVLFDGFAAAQFLSQLFVAQLTPPRRAIYGEEWMAQNAPDPKLAGRLQRRVLPEFVTIEDDPTREAWQGVRLSGYQPVDDEGVPGRPLVLVEKGRLLTLPMSRTPTAKIRESNGHARFLPNQWVVPAATSVFVRSSAPRADLVKELRALAKEAGSEYGLLVTRLEDPDVANAYRWNPSTEPTPMLSAPLFVYKVHVSDGRMEPVRGLVFDEVSIRTLRDIAAMGKDAVVYNLTQPFPGTGYRTLTSIVTPSILVEEMELKAGQDREPLTVSGNPLFAQPPVTR